MNRNFRRQRRGYLLLMTLFAIATIGVLMIGFARRSTIQAIDAIQQTKRLQSKWGTASCERLALKNHQFLLSEPKWDDKTNRVMRVSIQSSSSEATLGRQRFEIRLDDESAKLNVNQQSAFLTDQELKGAIRQICNVDRLMLRFRGTRPQSRNLLEPRFASLEQLVSNSELQADYPDLLFEVSQRLTCWSNSVNPEVAPEEIFNQTVKSIAGATNAFKISRQVGKLPVPELMKELALDQNTMDSLERWVKVRSTAQSVWVTNRSDAGSRHSYCIRQQATKTLVRYRSFNW